MKRFALALAALVTLAAPGRAQTFFYLPDGNLAYNTTFTSTGALKCLAASVAGATCLSVSGGIRLISATSVLDLAYTSLSGPVTSTNVRVPFSFGTLGATLTGSSPFTYTQPLGASQALFGLALTLSVGTPASSYNDVLEFRPNGLGTFVGTSTNGVTDYLFQAYQAVPPAPYSKFGGVVIDHFGNNSFAGSTGLYAITAQIGSVPEPASIVLLGTGLVGVFGVARRKRAA